MTDMTDPAQIYLDFRYAARQFLDFRLGFCSGDFARECIRLFRQSWNGIDGKGQCVAKCISRNASAAARGLGPVLALAFTRLALILRSLVKRRFFLRSL